jgi:hypothetical protein
VFLRVGSKNLAWSRGDLCSRQNIDVLLLAHVLKHVWPYGGTHFFKVRLLEQKHMGSGLPNPTANVGFALYILPCCLCNIRVYRFEIVILVRIFVERKSTSVRLISTEGQRAGKNKYLLVPKGSE